MKCNLGFFLGRLSIVYVILNMRTVALMPRMSSHSEYAVNNVMFGVEKFPQKWHYFAVLLRDTFSSDGLSTKESRLFLVWPVCGKFKVSTWENLTESERKSIDRYFDLTFEHL